MRPYPSRAQLEGFDWKSADPVTSRAWQHFEPLHALHGTWSEGEPTAETRPDLVGMPAYIGKNVGPLAAGDSNRQIRARKMAAEHPDLRSIRHRERQRGPMFDNEAVAKAIRGGATPVGFDPRELHGTQKGAPNKAALDYYLKQGDDYRTPFADEGHAGNHVPVVYTDRSGKNLILSGHHRARAALLQGRQFMARHVTGEI